MALLFYKDPEHSDDIVPEIRRRRPDLEVRIYPDLDAPERFDYLLGYDPPRELLEKLPNLKVIFSAGAGADALLATAGLPQVPLLRMVDDSLAELVSEFAAAQVLAWHRDLWSYRDQQTKAQWQPLPLRRARERRVGVLGLGAIGQRLTRTLRTLGFDVVGWSRTAKTIEGLPSFAGPAQLFQVLQQAEILVSILPLTTATHGILNVKTLRELPRGAVVVNVGRGAHLVESDLLALLEEGHLSGASLDVFDEEPLPEAHPFWRHPKVIVTPHVAGAISATAMAEVVTTQIARFEQGLDLHNVVDRAEGY
ncbi:MAG: glyoxylate/hydroxypyruvate reductase A [Kiloniellales bacterium]|nr:glyoxylate/hydroxypyruvate reductase A [Kiloniellales bacterium]